MWLRMPRIVVHGTSAYAASTSGGIWRAASPMTIKFQTTALRVLGSARSSSMVMPATKAWHSAIASSMCRRRNFHFLGVEDIDGFSVDDVLQLWNHVGSNDQVNLRHFQ